MNPFTPLALLFGGCLAAALVTFLAGWLIVPATPRTKKIATRCYIGIVLAMMVMAAMMVASVLTAPNPHARDAAFSVIPPEVLMVIVVLGFACSGMCRGLNLQKRTVGA